jgi:hypothetical protein
LLWVRTPVNCPSESSSDEKEGGSLSFPVTDVPKPRLEPPEPPLEAPKPPVDVPKPFCLSSCDQKKTNIPNLKQKSIHIWI